MVGGTKRGRGRRIGKVKYQELTEGGEGEEGGGDGGVR